MSLISGGQLRVTIRAFQIIDWSWSLPYKWCPKSQSFILLPTSRQYLNQFRLLIAYLNFFLILIQMAYTWQWNSILVKTYCVMSIAVYIMMLSGSHLNCHRPSLLISLLNSMLNFEKRQLSDKTFQIVQTPHRFIKFLIIYNAISVIFPVPYFFNTLMNPCLPSYVGSFLLLDQCNSAAMGYPPDNIQTQLGRKIFVALIAFFNWQYLMPGMAVHMCLMFVQGLSFPTYLRNYGR